MDIKRLDARIAASSQIRRADIAAIARAGYRSIICNRPDGEEQRQLRAKDIEAAAVAARLASQGHYSSASVLGRDAERS